MIGHLDGWMDGYSQVHICSDSARVLRLGSNRSRKQQLSLLQLTALCEALASDTHLEYCDLSYCDSTPVSTLHDPSTATFGTAGAEIVARLMRSNSTIRYIILEGNGIGSQVCVNWLVTCATSLDTLPCALEPITQLT